MGQIICNLGDSLGDDLPGTLHIFLERLKNEITRLTTVKALTLIAGREGMMLRSPYGEFSESVEG
jgi:cullin-associated NEDD8-dissociated protein 1